MHLEVLDVIEMVEILCEMPDQSPIMRTALKSLAEAATARKSDNDSVLRMSSMSITKTEESRENFPPYSDSHTVIVILGSPGIGKSQFGRYLVEGKFSSKFVDIGWRLRNRGDLKRGQRLPTESRMREQFEVSLELLTMALDEYMATDGKNL